MSTHSEDPDAVLALSHASSASPDIRSSIVDNQSSALNTRASTIDDHRTSTFEEKPLTEVDEKNVGIPEDGIAANITAPNGPPISTKPAPLSKMRFAFVFGSMLLCVFLFALDQLIVTTAIPKIVSEFDSLPQVAWLATGFFIPLCAFSLAWGQYLTIAPSKWILLSAVFIFEMGSLVCAVAPSMNVLIFGRALAGLGASGIFSASVVILIEITSLQERSTYLGLFGACFGVASIAGPLVGGAFTDHVSWRWCFYVNLPIGGAAFLMLCIAHKAQPPLGASKDNRTLVQKIIQLDWVGTLLALCFAVILCLPFEWGGVDRAWSSGSVVATLVLIPVSLGLLFGWSLYYSRAMVPLYLLKRRTIIGSAATGTFGWMSFMAIVYYLSIEYQSVAGVTATKAGIYLLPMICVQTLLIVISGKLVSITGRYKYLCCAGPPLIAIGSGLLYWSNMTTHLSYFLGFEAMVGVGVAFFLQNVMVAAQTELKAEPHLISRAMGFLNFFNFMGRILGTSVSTSIFNNLLPQKLAVQAPTLDPALVDYLRGSVAAIRTAVPLDLQPGVIEGYRLATQPVYLYAMASALVATLTVWLIKNDSTIETVPGKADGKLDNAAQPTVIAE